MWVFLDPFSMTIPDPEHSEFEVRYIDLGLSDKEPFKGNWGQVHNSYSVNFLGPEVKWIGG